MAVSFAELDAAIESLGRTALRCKRERDKLYDLVDGLVSSGTDGRDVPEWVSELVSQATVLLEDIDAERV